MTFSVLLSMLYRMFLLLLYINLSPDEEKQIECG